MSHDRTFQGPDVGLLAVATKPGAERQSQGSASPPPLGWVVVPEMVGVATRVAVWTGAFCLVMFGLFTYAAPTVGAFLFIVLLARYIGKKRH